MFDFPISTVLGLVTWRLDRLPCVVVDEGRFAHSILHRLIDSSVHVLSLELFKITLILHTRCQLLIPPS